MKITKQQLRQIIKEELGKITQPRTKPGEPGYKYNNLQPWQQEKIQEWVHALPAELAGPAYNKSMPPNFLKTLADGYVIAKDIETAVYGLNDNPMAANKQWIKGNGDELVALIADAIAGKKVSLSSAGGDSAPEASEPAPLDGKEEAEEI